MIDVLNNYPNAIYLWGHNHSSADPLYDRVLGPGFDNIISIGQLVNGETKRINFFYAAAGCMSDYEYRSGATSTSMPGGVFVEGKGMLAAINDSNVTLMWYGRPEEQRPVFKAPSELDSLISSSDEMMVWYGGDAYRIFTKGVSSTTARGYTPWYSGTMYATWTGNSGFMNTGSNIVIIGFRSESGTALMDSATLDGLTISGYGPKAGSAGALTPGSYAIVPNTARSLIFVVMHTVSDGVVWLPGILQGDVQVLNALEDTITLYDPEEEWNTLTWQNLLDAVMAMDATSIVDAGKIGVGDLSGKITGTEGWFLRVGAKDYLVKAGEPPPDSAFQPPAELEPFMAAAERTKIWHGHVDYLDNNDGWGSGTMQGMTSLQSLGENIVIIGIDPLTVATAPASIASYGGAPVADPTTLLETPGSWYAAYSSIGYGFVILHLFPPAELSPMINAPGARHMIWYGHDDYVGNNSGWGSSTMLGMTSLQPLGENIVIVGIDPLTAATAPASIAFFGGAAVADASALIATPGSWFALYSSNGYGFVIFNIGN